MRRMVRPAAWVLALFALAGCGMYGPLYLVEEEEPAAAAESPEVAAPAEPAGRAEPAGVVIDPGMLPAGDIEPEEDDEDEEDEQSPEPRRTDAGPEGAS
jgi:predicted small lipoprotein YifL